MELFSAHHLGFKLPFIFYALSIHIPCYGQDIHKTDAELMNISSFKMKGTCI